MYVHLTHLSFQPCIKVNVSLNLIIIRKTFFFLFFNYINVDEKKLYKCLYIFVGIFNL